MKKQNYLKHTHAAYRNKSLKNLKGEKWAAVPGLEDFYEVSNFGRIKSLAREILYANGKVIFKQARIIMAGVSPAPNYFAGDFTYQLMIALSVNRKVVRYSVARLVYHCFVSVIELKDERICIVQRDGDGLNCHYKNLLALRRTQKQKRIYERNRIVSCFAWIDMKEVVKKDMERRQQPVTQYNKSGKRLNVFQSVKAASEATGIERSGISAVLSGTYQTAGGFVWKKGKGEKRIDLDGYFDAWKKGYKEKRGKKVTQCTLEGKEIKVYPSISDAADETCIPYSNISRAVSKHLKTAGGFTWKAVE
jgi:hypothetical protein